ncbi:HD domain-containing protein [Dissulfurirhabdus thermomarina]|uniref:HD domain-containing protein n=1 Tax=Dissulfurirhabdus thermomarina TaxID=1765737 RepID=A0A6N9TSX3_DISTH|nr:HD domain-containing protein [Dissulfurirhabdus thermomarina]NDY42547.1 HD domain-containing protein [Dissulfurirhabdus thermomarina]NMX23694.1 HD domain-containing protein [Dissulfurirhabdus thermomarina]
MEKGIYIRDIQPNTTVEGTFCVQSRRLLETRNGAPYLALTLMDRTGDMEARVWDRARELAPVCGEGSYLRVRAEAQVFRDATQLKVLDLEPVPEADVTPADFLPATPEDREALWEELRRLAGEIGDEVLQGLVRAVFSDRDFRRAFYEAPAAKRMHHAYLGGLLEHTVAVGSLALDVAGRYPRLDRDLLLAGALLHDIGKVVEFRFDRPPLDYTDQGRLIGHMVLGTSLVDRFAAAAGLPADHHRLLALKHLVLSHHGQREFGAPVLPMMEEAVALNLIDDLDAKLNYLSGLRGEVEGEGYGWTPYQRLLDRYFFLPGAAEEAAEAPAAELRGRGA